MLISWIPRGSGAPGLMTGSAGTAMDVLVTCFSKMGGGSGRRGCKYRAQVGVRRVSQIPFRVSRGLQKCGRRYTLDTFREKQAPRSRFLKSPKGSKSMAGMTK